MRVAIIGFGNIGHALAKAFARKGIEVSIATTRGPASFAADAAAIGPKIFPKTLAEAVKADIIFLAVRFDTHPDVAKALPTWKGKTIIDVTNAYGVPPEKLGGQPSSKVVAQAFTGAKLVKGFNHLVAAVLDQDPAIHGGMVRGENLSDTMSSYLVQRLTAQPNIEIHFGTEVTALHGGAHLERITLRSRGEENTLPTRGLYLMIGHPPMTQFI